MAVDGRPRRKPWWEVMHPEDAKGSVGMGRHERIEGLEAIVAAATRADADEFLALLLISHRFSSVCSADRIYVLEHGRVVEQGSHDELMAGGGRYAELFTLQARAYLGR